MAKIVGKPNAEDVKRVAVAALVAALDDGKEKARKNPRLTGMRAVATGAVLYTAGKAAYSGRRFISEHLSRDGEPEDEAYQEEEDVDEGDDVDEEPAGEEDEDFEEDRKREEEPVAEEDEDYEDEDEDDDEEERSAASEPPVHRDDEDVDDADLPPRPSRKRTPVGRR
jgi:hypothetical protein